MEVLATVCRMREVDGDDDSDVIVMLLAVAVLVVVVATVVVVTGMETDKMLSVVRDIEMEPELLAAGKTVEKGTQTDPI